MLALGACAAQPTPAPEPPTKNTGMTTAAAPRSPPALAEPPEPAPEQPTSDPPVDDDATRQALAATIRGYMPDLQTCYEAELPRDPSLAGKMTYTITVEPSGDLSEVVVDVDTVADDRVRACVVEMIEGWTFVADDIEEPSEITFSVRFTAV